MTNEITTAVLGLLGFPLVRMALLLWMFAAVCAMLAFTMERK